MTAPDPAIRVVPANAASWADLQTVFGTRGTARRCQCQRYKLRRLDAFSSFTEVSRPTLHPVGGHGNGRGSLRRWR